MKYCNDNKSIAPVQRMAMLQSIEVRMGSILKILGFDYKHDHNMKDTPRRVAKMFVYELFDGCFSPEPAFTVFPNVKHVDEMVLLKDIRVTSTCAHHLMPFTGRCHIGYLPKAKLCGVSKLARVVHWFARRPQIQEELTSQIAEYLQVKLQPRGIMVVMSAQHNCMLCRGVQEDASVMKTSKILGVFKKNQAARAEFLSLIRG